MYDYECFYVFLKEGFNKDEALHRAKLQYVQQIQSDGLYHPFYWAAFVHIGEVDAIDFPGWFQPWWLILVAIGLGLGFWFFRTESPV